MFSIESMGKIFFTILKYLFYFICAVILFLFITWLIEIFGVDPSNKFAGIFTPLIIGSLTAYVALNQYKLAQKQHDLAKEQKALTARQADIAEQQASVARENKEIAHNKLKLELFDKRYAVFEQFIEYFGYYFDLRLDIDYYVKLSPTEEQDYTTARDRPAFIKPIYERALERINEIQENNAKNKQSLEIVLAKTKFLYDLNIHEILFDFSKRTIELGSLQYNFLIEELEFYKSNYLTDGGQHVSNIQKIEEEKTVLARMLGDKITNEIRPFLHVPE